MDQDKRNNCYHIGIFGMGPRGVYALERITAICQAEPLKKPIILHIFEPFEFGAGATYRTSQPDYLLLNTISSQITAYWDGTTQGVGPRREGYAPTLYEWLTSQGEKIGPNDYPSRAQHGRYLNAVCQSILATVPTNMTVICHHEAVLDLECVQSNANGSIYAITKLDKVLLHKVLITTGHSSHTSPSTQDWQDFVKEQQAQGFRDIHFHSTAYPIEEKLARINQSCTIGIAGLGLTAIDIILAATVGKGGKFYELSSGELEYVKSGNEPNLVAWCRRGVPLSARAQNEKGIAGRYIAKFLTIEKIDQLRDEAIKKRGNRKLDFMSEVMPVLLQDMEYVYYSTLKGEEFGMKYLSYVNDPLAMDNLLATIPANDRFDWELISEPTKKIAFTNEQEYATFLLAYLRSEIQEAELGNQSSALKAACEVLRDIRDNIRYVVDLGGLLPQSHQHFDSFFTPINNRLAVGPPYLRHKQLLALSKAGILDLFVGPNPKIIVNPEESCFDIQGLENKRSVQVLIQAILPTPDCYTDTSLFLQNLLRKKILRPFENRFGQEFYIPGGVDVTRNGQAIGSDGKVNLDISVLGVLTEGALLYTTISARPQVNSRALADAGRWAVRVVNEVNALDERLENSDADSISVSFAKNVTN